MTVLDQSGQRDCFDHEETLVRDGHGTAESATTAGGCAQVVADSKCDQSAAAFAAEPTALYSAYCPVSCNLCSPPPFEQGVTQSVTNDGAYVYAYTYPWLPPNGAINPEDPASRVPIRDSGFLAGSVSTHAQHTQSTPQTCVCTVYA